MALAVDHVDSSLINLLLFRVRTLGVWLRWTSDRQVVRGVGPTVIASSLVQYSHTPIKDTSVKKLS